MLLVEQLERRDQPAFIADWGGPETILRYDLSRDGQPEIIAVAGVGGSARVQITDETGNVLDNFIAFEDEFRGGGWATVSNGTLFISPGIGGGPRVLTYRFGEGIIGSYPVPVPIDYRGGVQIVAAPDGGVFAIAGQQFSHLTVNGFVQQSVFIGPDWRFEPTGGWIESHNRTFVILERGPVIDAHVADVRRIEVV